MSATKFCLLMQAQYHIGLTMSSPNAAEDAKVQQVNKLTAELAERQRIKEADAPMSTTAWKILAQRLRHERLDAEERQKRLVAQIEARFTLIRDIYFRPACHGDTELSGIFCQHKRIPLEHADVATFNTFLQEMDKVHDKTCEVYSRSGLEEASETDWGYFKQWIEDGETGNYYYKSKRDMKFDLHRSSQTLWDASQLYCRQDIESTRIKGKALEILPRTSFASVELKPGHGLSVVQRSVTRRYEQSNRVIVVWRSFIEGEGVLAGIHADETGCDELTASAKGTMMKILYTTYLCISAARIIKNQP
ncbi:unnamed protein product [Phytophthora lilii]|uniref:Unnamed protein product n=1 Tax=Phytophthora lilii TaxID=2077276 RepID=A0A9W6X8D2_9STRA|nr:unnamed protein product [Phytophthora lilii]